MIENGFIAGLVFVVAMQGFRQLMPNLFSYLWQEHTCNVVPQQYRKSKWFTDKNSLLYVAADGFEFEVFSVFTQGNARNVIVYFAIIFWFFSSIPLVDIREGKQVIWDLLIIFAVMGAFFNYAWRVSKKNTNPDVFIHSVLNVASIAFSFEIALLIIS